MKYYSDLQKDMKELGVNLLTGEACGLYMRVLCDLTQEGIDLWRSFTRSDPSGEPWNREGERSVMIPHSMFRDLWIWGMVRSGLHVALFILSGDIIEKFELVAFNPDSKEDSEQFEEYKHMLMKMRGMKLTRTYKKTILAGNGMDNRHAFTGRIT